MPSEAFNEDQAYEVIDGVLDIEDCEDPDAVADIINEEYIENPYNINYRDNSNPKNEDSGLDNKIIYCCILVIVIFILYLIL
ncbi:MAG: hypothetical protein BZ137_01465 [Methanosphaera sp. rholeuAM130]|nr:hypothetical protein [Methanosphaera sp.]RAP54581.1 MAG: hypothetical protein BZ137_01465 [Methanosphaera sp. rholeuAM130]